MFKHIIIAGYERKNFTSPAPLARECRDPRSANRTASGGTYTPPSGALSYDSTATGAPMPFAAAAFGAYRAREKGFSVQHARKNPAGFLMRARFESPARE